MKSILVSAFSIAGLVLVAGAAQADDVRVIVGFKGDAAAGLVTAHGGRVHRTSGTWVAASLPAPAVARLRAQADVAYVEEDAVAETLGGVDAEGAKGKPSGGSTTPVPEDLPWGVDKIDADLAWATTTGNGVKVVVIDTGVDRLHPDLAANWVLGYDFVNGDTDPLDDNGHGSHVAGTIAAVRGNGFGYIGVAPGAALHAAKVLNRRGSGWLSDVAAGIDWAAAKGMQVANMSLGSSSSSVTLETACNAAATAGVLLVAAAGNSGDGSRTTEEWGYPAAYASVVAVGSTEMNDSLSSFSNTGRYLELAAPGRNIPSTYKSGAYKTLSGTSMASPHAAGMAALLLEGDATKTTIRARLREKVAAGVPATPVDPDDDGLDDGYGYGRIDWNTTP